MDPLQACKRPGWSIVLCLADLSLTSPACFPYFSESSSLVLAYSLNWLRGQMTNNNLLPCMVSGSGNGVVACPYRKAWESAQKGNLPPQVQDLQE